MLLVASSFPHLCQRRRPKLAFPPTHALSVLSPAVIEKWGLVFGQTPEVQLILEVGLHGHPRVLSAESSLPETVANRILQSLELEYWHAFRGQTMLIHLNHKGQEELFVRSADSDEWVLATLETKLSLGLRQLFELLSLYQLELEAAIQTLPSRQSIEAQITNWFAKQIGAAGSQSLIWKPVVFLPYLQGEQDFPLWNTHHTSPPASVAQLRPNDRRVLVVPIRVPGHAECNDLRGLLMEEVFPIVLRELVPDVLSVLSTVRPNLEPISLPFLAEMTAAD